MEDNCSMSLMLHITIFFKLKQLDILLKACRMIMQAVTFSNFYHDYSKNKLNDMQKLDFIYASSMQIYIFSLSVDMNIKMNVFNVIKLFY